MDAVVEEEQTAAPEKDQVSEDNIQAEEAPKTSEKPKALTPEEKIEALLQTVQQLSEEN